jgi:hypothetical protein
VERTRKSGYSAVNRRVRGTEPPEAERFQPADNGTAVVSRPKPSEEPVADTPVDLAWSSEHRIYLESGAEFAPPEGFEVMQACFDKLLRAVLAACDPNATENCDFFMVWAPSANWYGLHTQSVPHSLIQINLAKFPGLVEGVGSLAWFQLKHTFCHELAHEDSSCHDNRHEQAIKEHREALAHYLHHHPIV